MAKHRKHDKSHSEPYRSSGPLPKPAHVLPFPHAEQPASSNLSPLLMWPAYAWQMSMNYWQQFLPQSWLNLMSQNQARRPEAMPHPKTESRETEHAYLYRAALPDIRRDQLALTVHNGALLLRIKDGTSGQRMRRSFPLPVYSNGRAIKATFHNGLLTVTIPKSRKPVKPGREPIEIV